MCKVEFYLTLLHRRPSKVCPKDRVLNLLFSKFVRPQTCLDSTPVLLRRVTIGRSRPCLVNNIVFRPILSCQTPKCTLTVTKDAIKHSFWCLPIFVMTARATNELLQSFPCKKSGLAARHESLQSAGLEYRLELMPRFSDVCLKLLTIGRGHPQSSECLSIM